jgi:hypothetical protein
MILLHAVSKMVLGKIAQGSAQDKTAHKAVVAGKEHAAAKYSVIARQTQAQLVRAY